MPVIFARCGMTLKASPALKVVTETTALCSGSTLRATIDCSACDDRGAGDDRVDGGVRLGGVAAVAFDLDGELVGRRHQRAGPDGEMAERQARHVVHAVDLLDAEALHQAVLDHRAAAGAALLRRLEDDDRGAGEAARLGEVVRGAEQHGGVAVMAAGVHLARRLGGPGLAGLLVDRQRVHVGAEADDAAAACRRPRPS